MAWLVELLLPVRLPDGRVVPAEMFERLQRTLTGRFGGVTAYERAPAHGRWDSGDGVETDELVSFEIMAETFDRDWWLGLKHDLEMALEQEDIVVRAHEIERLHGRKRSR